jgi:hypothetical protein
MNAVKLAAAIDELRIIAHIVARAQRKMIYFPHQTLKCTTDLDAVHSNGCSLRLLDLLAADDVDFDHDLRGIKKHIDRDTGKLRDLFRPRCAKASDGWKGVWPAPKPAPSDGWTTNPPDGRGIQSFKPSPGGWTSSF